MYCPECRERGDWPWQHEESCVEGLRHQLRWYQLGIPAVIAVLVVESILLVVVFARLGSCH